jgi:thymidylate synthase
MVFDDFLTILGGVSIATIAYFLKQALNQLEEVKELTYNNKNKLDVLEKEYMLKMERLNERLNEKIELLHEAIEKLNHNVEKLGERIK